MLSEDAAITNLSVLVCLEAGTHVIQGGLINQPVFWLFRRFLAYSSHSVTVQSLHCDHNDTVQSQSQSAEHSCDIGGRGLVHRVSFTGFWSPFSENKT